MAALSTYGLVMVTKVQHDLVRVQHLWHAIRRSRVDGDDAAQTKHVQQGRDSALTQSLQNEDGHI